MGFFHSTDKNIAQNKDTLLFIAEIWNISLKIRDLLFIAILARISLYYIIAYQEIFVNTILKQCCI